MFLSIFLMLLHLKELSLKLYNLGCTLLSVYEVLTVVCCEFGPFLLAEPK